MTTLSLVVAVAANGVIGVRGGLPWRIRADLARFRRITMGKPIVMGRKTFQSIGRVLDGRDNIVVTGREDFVAPGAILARGLDEALLRAEECARARNAAEMCVIGGEALFRETLSLAGRLHVTHVDASPEGDVFFPPIDHGRWIETSRENLPGTEGDTATGVYVIYERRRSPT